MVHLCPVMRVSLPVAAIVTLTLVAAACKREDGTVTVHSLKFQGVKAVDADRLKAALATRVSSRIPWGKK